MEIEDDMWDSNLKEIKYFPIKGDEWEKLGYSEKDEIGRVDNYVIKRASCLKSEYKSLRLLRDPWNISFKDENYIEEAEKTGKSARELAVEDAQYHAKFYQNLVDKRIYHPDTQFGICADDEGYPTMFAIMPFMKEIDQYSKLDYVMGQNKRWFIKEYEMKPFFDLTKRSNYRMGDDENYYCIDLHLFDDLKNYLKIPKELREKLESQYEKRCEI